MNDKLVEILQCPFCYDKLDENYYCEKCCRKFKNRDENIISLLANIDCHKENVINLYNELGIRKADNPISRFSTYLNYGIKNENENKTRAKASNDLIESIYEGIDFNNKKVLDIGCGRGGTLFNIAHLYSPLLMVGIDLSRENIKFCMRKKSSIKFVVGDAENLPFQKSIFDVVLNVESALHYNNKEQFFKEVSRTMTSSGIFVYVDIVETKKMKKTEEILIDCGFQIEEYRDYSIQVINSMESFICDVTSADQLFNHKKTYCELKEQKKKYAMWKLHKL